VDILDSQLAAISTFCSFPNNTTFKTTPLEFTLAGNISTLFSTHSSKEIKQYKSLPCHVNSIQIKYRIYVISPLWISLKRNSSVGTVTWLTTRQPRKRKRFSEVFDLVRCYAGLIGSQSPTFRNYISVPPSRVKLEPSWRWGRLAVPKSR
jgi:hypothetical protein